ncbi:MAG: CoA transferase [Ilumatobacteraceae bacterium]
MTSTGAEDDTHPRPPDRAGALHGIRVLDLTSVVMGPLATQVLGDLGAEVITIEDRAGDANRSIGAGPVPGLSGMALNLMRNKRSVGLDLKDERGRAAFLAIAATCDVVVTNLRPGPLRRLRLAYDDVRAVRPDVVFCQAAGFPSDSDRADDAAYDDVIQSASGICDLARRMGGDPMPVPTILADKVSGYAIVTAVLAALFHRSVTGAGQRVEVPMVETMTSFVLVEHGVGSIPEPQLGSPGHRRLLTEHRRPQRTLDGWVHVFPYDERSYRCLFEGAGRPDLADDRITTPQRRLEHIEQLYRDVATVMASKTTADWLAFCRANSIAASEVAQLEDVVDALPLADHPHAGPYRVVPAPFRLDATPPSVRRPAPLHGEHGREVLAEVGLAAEDVAALAADGVLFGSGLADVPD